MSAEPKSLAISEARELGKKPVTADQLTLARQTVAKDLDNNQFALFCYNCERLGVHPLDGMLVPILRSEGEGGDKRMTFVSTVDLLRSRAAETGEYAGSDDPSFEYKMQDESQPSDAHVTVWRFVQGERCAFSATARWEEYYPGEGKKGFMWRAKPHVMLGKCAEALALRKGFPKQLAGLYIPEELQQENVTGRQQQGKTQQKKQQQPVGDVMCSFCGQKNGHTADCKYAQQCSECHAPAGKPHASGCSQPQKEASKPIQNEDAQNEAEKPKLVKWLMQVDAVDEREIQGKKRILVTGFNAANENVTLYCWHTGETADRLKAIKAKTKCVFMVKPSQSGDKTYFNLEEIVEITGEKRNQEEMFQK